MSDIEKAGEIVKVKGKGFQVTRGVVAGVVFVGLVAGYAVWMGPKFYDYAYLDPETKRHVEESCERLVRRGIEVGDKMSVNEGAKLKRLCYEDMRERIKDEEREEKEKRLSEARRSQKK